MTKEDNVFPAWPDSTLYAEVYDIGAKAISTAFSTWLDLTQLYLKQIAEITPSYAWNIDSPIEAFQRLIDGSAILPVGPEPSAAATDAPEESAAPSSPAGAPVRTTKGRREQSSASAAG